MATNSTGRRRAGAVWNHNCNGAKKFWKKFVNRQMRRGDKVLERTFNEPPKKKPR